MCDSFYTVSAQNYQENTNLDNCIGQNHKNRFCRVFVAGNGQQDLLRRIRRKSRFCSSGHLGSHLDSG